MRKMNILVVTGKLASNTVKASVNGTGLMFLFWI